MSKNVCIICLVCEATTRLFCMQAARSEDERKYEYLTGIKLNRPAFVCQRCSIDLGLAATLKQKALESAKLTTPPIIPNQFKVPANKNSSVNNAAIKPQVPFNDITLTPILPQTTINKTATPQYLNSTESSKTALPLNSNMTRTDKIMSSASIISSTLVNPPMDMSRITDLFKTKPNISIIKTKMNDDGNKGPKDSLKVQFPKDDEEKKAPVNQNSRITKRRQTVCAENFQNQIMSRSGRKLGNFQPTIYAEPKKIVKAEVEKKGDKKPAVIKQEKVTQKRQAEQIDEKYQPKKKYPIRSTRAAKSPEPEYQYWIKSKADGYYIETFSSLATATSYLEKLPPDATYGPLSDD